MKVNRTATGVLGRNGTRVRSSTAGPDRGDTLVEVLIAMAVVAIAGLAILIGFSTSILGSSNYRTVATADTVLRSAAEQATSAIEAQLGSAWDACTDTVFTPTQALPDNPFTLPTGYTATITQVQYWSASSQVFQSACIPDAAQLVQITLQDGGRSYVVSVVLDDPQAKALDQAGAATKLVFVQQPGTAIAGSSIAPPPVVAVEDVNGNIVTTDLSPAVLEITPGTGTAGATISASCSGAEFYGVITFSNCAISEAGSGFTLTATDGTLTHAVSQSFAVLPPAASQLAFTTAPSGNQTESPTAKSGPYVITEQDYNGNAVVATSPVTVTLSTSSAGTTIGGAPFFSLSSNGSASTAVTTLTIPAGSSSTPSFYYSDTEAGSPTLAGTNSQFLAANDSITIPLGSTSRVGFTTPPPSNVTPGQVFPVVVAEEDAYGNLEGAGSASVTLSASGGGFKCGTSPTHFSAGSASFTNCSYATSGTTAFVLTAASFQLTSATASTTVGAGPPSMVVFTTPPPVTTSAGSSFSIVIAEEDANGNIETLDSTSPVALSANGGGFTCTTTPATFTNGVATMSGCSYATSASSPYTLTASSGSLTPATAQTQVDGPATQLVYTTSPPLSTVAGSTFTVKVAEEDALGNVEVNDSTTTVSLAAPGGSGFTCSGSISAHVAQGVATFSNCSYTTAALGDVLTASSGTLTPATASTNVSPNTAVKLAYTTAPPATTTAGNTFTVSVHEVDAYGNVETQDSSTAITLSASQGGGGLSCTTTPAALTNGAASYAGCTFTVASTTAYTVSDSASGVSSASSTTLVSPGAANKLVYATAPPSTVKTATTFNVVVDEEDQFGNLETTDSTTAIALASSGGFHCTTAPTHVSGGVATYTGCSFTTASATPFTVTASATGLSSATSSVTVYGAATKLVYTTAPPSSTSAGSTFSVVVAEEDANGTLEANDSTTTLTLGAAPAGSGFSCSTSPTHLTNGTATYTGCAYTKSSATGYTLSATAGGLTPATAVTTVLANSATKVVYTTSPPATTTAGTTFSVVVAEEDTYGNVETSDSTTAVALGANNGGGGFACTSTPSNFTAGVATFSACAYFTTGTYTLTASSGSLVTATASTTVNPGSPTQLVYTTSPPSTTSAGSTFTVKVAEEDALGNVEVNDSTTTLTLAANSGGGGFSCQTTPTHVTNGVATYGNCSFTKAGSTYTLSATSGSLTPATASTNVSPNTAVKLAYTTAPPATTTAGNTFTVSVHEVDAYGNVETQDSSTAITLSASQGGGGLSCTTTPAALTNGAASYAGCTFTVASTTAYTVSDSASGVSSASSTTLVSPGAANKLVYATAPPSTVKTATTFNVVVDEEDQFGNLETTDSTTAIALASSGGFHCTTAPTHVSGGVATYTGCSFTTASATPFTVTASATGLSSATSSVTVYGAATKLVYTTAPPSSTSAGSTFSVVVAEEDANGTLEANDSTTTLTLGAAPAGSGFSCSTSPTHLTNGTATYTGCAYTKSSATGYTLSATAGGLTPATAVTTVLANSATKVVYTTSPPATTTAGTTFSVVVAEEDTYGNVETSDSTTAVALGANNGGGGFACTSTPSNFTAGVATFSACAYFTTGTYTLTASSGSLVTATASTTVNPGSPTQLVYTTSPPSTTSAGSTFTVVVADEDAYGNIETSNSSTTLTLAANSGGGGFSCQTTPTHVTNGVATYGNCSFTNAGTTYTLSATSGSLIAATATTTVTPGAATALAYTTAPPASVTAGNTFTVAVTEEDAYGNVETSDSSTAVSLSANGGGFTCSATATHVTAGVATSTGCSFMHVGSYTLTASSTGLTSATATVVVNHGPPSQLAFTTQPQTFEQGTGATAGSGTITIQLQDLGGNPTPAPAGGEVVTLSSSSSTGTFSTGTHVTIAGGTSSASFAYTDTAAGSPTLTATVASLATPSTTQVETILSSATSKITVTTSNATVTAGGTTTYAVKVTNATSTKSAFDVSAVNGLPAGASWSVTGTTCQAISNSGFGNSATFDVSVPTSSTTPNGANTVTFVVTQFSSATLCSGSQLDTAQGEATLTVNAAATQLVFVQQPTGGTHNTTITPAITVMTVDAEFDLVTTATTVQMAIGTNPSGASLLGTTSVTTSGGIATFSNLRISLAGTGYTLVASNFALTSATSNGFNES